MEKIAILNQKKGTKMKNKVYDKCDECGNEDLYWDATVDKDNNIVSYDDNRGPWCDVCECETTIHNSNYERFSDGLRKITSTM